MRASLSLGTEFSDHGDPWEFWGLRSVKELKKWALERSKSWVLWETTSSLTIETLPGHQSLKIRQLLGRMCAWVEVLLHQQGRSQHYCIGRDCWRLLMILGKQPDRLNMSKESTFDVSYGTCGGPFTPNVAIWAMVEHVDWCSRLRGCSTKWPGFTRPLIRNIQSLALVNGGWPDDCAQCNEFWPCLMCQRLRK